MSGKSGACCCCCAPCCARESFIGKETVWTGWHRRPPPRDPWDRRDKCAVRCAVDPEKRKEPPKELSKPKREAPGSCEDPPYTLDYDTSLAFIKRRLNDGKDETEEQELKFANLAVGIVGRRRESMLDNRLLHRNQVGVPLRCCRDMPCDDFIYGHASVPGWKVSDALQAWAGTGLQPPARQSVKKAPKRMCCTDILSLNRAAVNSGIYTAAEFRDYRNTHCLSFSKFARRGGERLPPLKVDKDQIYGRKSNYVTTMKEIMSDQELKEWQRCVRSCMRERMEVKKESRPDPWKENTAYVLRTCNNVKGPQTESLWHMPRFETKAKPHLCTFRSDTALVAAHRANSLDRVGRQGLFGEGIATKAVNKADLIYPYKN